MSKKFSFHSVLMLLVMLLTGCASTPNEGNEKTKNEILLAQQLASADQSRKLKPSGRLIFAGFAMHSQSKAFRNDVLTAERKILSVDPNAIIFKLSNPVLSQDADWPYATLENMQQVLTKVGELARPDDKVIVLMSTHGHIDKLGINIANKDHPVINSKKLNEMLGGLRGKPTVLILSACYSGSFLENVSGPSRIVLTAAAKDRASFGCQFHSTNTYFVDALFNQDEFADSSIEKIMEQAKVSIDKKERAQRLSPASLPQISIGGAAKTWSTQPLKSWGMTP